MVSQSRLSIVHKGFQTSRRTLVIHGTYGCARAGFSGDEYCSFCSLASVHICRTW
jgi:hypothetical protein